MTLVRPAALALAVAAAILPAAAQTAAPSQLAASVGWRLRDYGFSVDPRTLSTRQLAALHTLMISEGHFFNARHYTRIRQQIRSILAWDAPSPPEPAP